MDVRPRTKWKPGKRTVGGRTIHFRSRWEANYARYLNYHMQYGDKHVLNWEFESKTFWFEGIKRGTVSYLPDFEVLTAAGTHYIEVKGYMDRKSKTKLKRMAKYHPAVQVELVDTAAYTALEKEFQHVIVGWESA